MIFFKRKAHLILLFILFVFLITYRYRYLLQHLEDVKTNQQHSMVLSGWLGLGEENSESIQQEKEIVDQKQQSSSLPSKSKGNLMTEYFQGEEEKPLDDKVSHFLRNEVEIIKDTSAFESKLHGSDSQKKNMGRLRDYFSNNNKKYLVIQGDNRNRELWFKNDSEKQRGYADFINLSILRTYLWAKERNYAYLFHSRYEDLCSLSQGNATHVNNVKVSYHWCKILTILTSFEFVKDTNIKGILYLDTDAYPSFNGQYGIEDLEGGYKEEIPPIVMASDRGVWARLTKKFYPDPACNGIMYYQNNLKAKSFFNRLWYESFSWTTPYEIFKNAINIDIMMTNDEQPIDNIELSRYHSILVSEKKSTKKSKTSLVSKFLIKLNSSMTITASRNVLYDYQSENYRSIFDEVMKECCSPPFNILNNTCFDIRNSANVQSSNCTFKQYSSILDQDRLNFLKDLYPNEASTAIRNLNKTNVILNITPEGGRQMKELLSHKSGRAHGGMGKNFKEEVRELFLASFSNVSSENDVMNWAMNILRNEIPVFSFSEGILHLSTKEIFDGLHNEPSNFDLVNI